MAAGEDAAAEEAIAFDVGGELEIAVEAGVLDAFGEGFGDGGGFGELDDAADFEAGADGSEDAEAAIAADGKAEEIGVLPAAAGLEVARGGKDVEGIDFIDDGFEFEAAAVDVGEEAGRTTRRTRVG